MKRLAGLALITLITTPAEACHRFHTWKYPWPQQCGSANRFIIKAAVPVAPPPPPLDERQAAINKLKEMMK